MSTVYQAGSATLDITPPVGIKLAGFAALTDPSTSVELPLRTVAYAIEDPQQNEVILITSELIGFYDKAQQVRTRISEATGLSIEQIVLGVTHTHAGPCFREMDARKKGELDLDYVERLMSTLVEVAVKARQNKKPSTLAASAVRYPFGISRRKPDGKGGVVWAPYPEGIVDDVVSILEIRGVDDQELTGCLFSYGCHPTSRATLDIGGDFVGFAYQELDRLEAGVDWGFFQGFAGDVKPAYAVLEDGSQFSHASSEQIREQGNRWAELILNTVNTADKIAVSGDIRAASEVLKLELRRPSKQLHDQFQNSEVAISRFWAENNPYVEEASAPEPVGFEVQTVAFGNSVALVFLAGEISAGYAAPLRQILSSQYQLVVPVGYANGMVGYIPTAQQIPEGGYEVYFASQHSNRPGFYTEDAEPQILASIKRLLN